jgi:hypothetical protein
LIRLLIKTVLALEAAFLNHPLMNPNSFAVILTSIADWYGNAWSIHAPNVSNSTADEVS